MDWSWEVWLIIAVVLVLFELLSMDFFFAMLAGGAALGSIAAALDLPGVVVWLIALGGAAAGLALVRPKVVAMLHRTPDLKIGAEALVAQQAIVLEDVAPHAPGRVKIGGDEWTALPADDSSTYCKTTRVVVEEIRGATAYVRTTGGQS